MSRKPENVFIESVHRHLPPMDELYRMKNHNEFNAGIADVWYSGTASDLWVEYKFIVVPVRDTTVIDLVGGDKPVISHLQQAWLHINDEDALLAYEAEQTALGYEGLKVSAGERGGTLDELCGQIRALPRHQLWRWGQAGDLPGDGKRIDAKALQAVVLANRGRCGFGFTHYDPKLVANARAIAAANAGGFTLNLSADNVAEADKLVALGIAPVVVVLPKGTTKHFKTPAGNHVSVCPATVRDDVTCARCGICQNKDRKAIMGFPAHGSGAAKAHVISLTGLTKSLTKSRRTTPFDDGSVETAKRKTA